MEEEHEDLVGGQEVSLRRADGDERNKGHPPTLLVGRRNAS